MKILPFITSRKTTPSAAFATSPHTHPSCFSGGPSFKERVTRFWNWYAPAAQRFYQTIEDHKSHELADEVTKNIHGLLGEFAWVFGPGANGQGHSLTLSGEGDRYKQLLTQYWAECAPQLDGWTFYPARQPNQISERFILKIKDHDFSLSEFRLVSSIDEDRRIIHLTAWHPVFAKVEDKEKWFALFLALDESLGEYGVQQWIGEIDISTDAPADSIPIKELPTLIAELEECEGWKKCPPGEEITGYSIKNPNGRFPRGDVVAGTTAHMRLIEDYIETDGRWSNPLAKYGADFAYLSIPMAWLPRGDEVDARGKIEDALDAILRTEKSGCSLGGATGTENAYIDLLLLDGAHSRELVLHVAREQGLPKEAALCSFAIASNGVLPDTGKA
jgi:hypothetical protein